MPAATEPDTGTQQVVIEIVEATHTLHRSLSRGTRARTRLRTYAGHVHAGKQEEKRQQLQQQIDAVGKVLPVLEAFQGRDSELEQLFASKKAQLEDLKEQLRSIRPLEAQQPGQTQVLHASGHDRKKKHKASVDQKAQDDDELFLEEAIHTAAKEVAHQWNQMQVTGTPRLGLELETCGNCGSSVQDRPVLQHCGRDLQCYHCWKQVRKR